jgi:GT2 family glycosyltransferase
MRVAAVAGVGGYREDVIAAEDDELCVRLRAAGWQVWRLDAEMTWHDAAILGFGQWWRRSVRAGHGFAQVGARHPEHFAAERRRVWFWGALLPAVGLAGLFVAPWVAVAAAALYAASFGRVALRLARTGVPAADALRFAGLLTLSKVCNLQGVLTYWARRARGRGQRIIEYK